MHSNYILIIILIKKLINISLLFIITFIYTSSDLFGNQKINSYKNDFLDISFINARDTKQGDLFALFIKMEKNWKTYWRYPGDSGFAPEFKILSSRNLKKIEISWPTPKVFYENGTTINGYKNDLILPIFFIKNNPADQMEFEIELTMGFCDDICIPIKFMIISKYALKTSEKQNKTISNSLNNIPKELSTSKSLVICDVNKIGSKMILISKFSNNFFSKKNKIDHLVIEYKDVSVWFSEINKMSNNLGYTAEINSIEDKNFFLDKSKIKYTIITNSGGFQKSGCTSPKN